MDIVLILKINKKLLLIIIWLNILWKKMIGMSKIKYQANHMDFKVLDDLFYSQNYSDITIFYNNYVYVYLIYLSERHIYFLYLFLNKFI